MSAKPSVVPVFNTDATNRVAPTSGQRATGWPTNAIPTSGVFNNEMNLYGQWAQYLSDGALSGNHSIAGTLDVSGALTTAASFTVGGTLTVGGQPLSFTDFTYTADNTTNQLAKTAHGLETGDGPVRTSNSGGGLPGGLAAATDYYAIKVDADHIKAATSRANALAGTFIDITSNGTGTQTLLHQAGTTRVTDATVTRNLTVGGNAAVTGTVTAAVRTLIVPLSAPVTNTSGASAQAVTINASSPTFWVGQIGGLIVGQTIAAIRLRCRDSATGPTKVQAHLTIGTDGATGSPTSNSNESDGSGNAQYVTMSPNLVVAVDNVYIVSANLTTGTQNCSLYHLEVDITGPVG